MKTGFGITEGSVSGNAGWRARQWLNVFLLLSAVMNAALFRAQAAGTVTIDGTQTYQVIDGFGVNANSQIWSNSALQPVVDALINQAGLTQFRVIIGNANWEATNDNSDPDSMNWAYYNTVYTEPRFQNLWAMMSYLNQRGISNGLVPKVSGPAPVWMGGLSLKAGLEDEYAETVASMLYYARYTNGLQFTEVQPDNEPDQSESGVEMSGSSQYVTVLHDLALQLNNNGMSDVRFSAPDLAITDTSWMTAIMNDPLVMGKIANFDIHAYEGGGGNQSDVYSFIQQSPYPATHLWASEFNVWCSNCENGVSGDNSWGFAQGTAGWLLYLLNNGVSAGMVFEAYDSLYAGYDTSTGQSTAPTWSYWGLFAVDDINATPFTFTPRKGFYTVAQIALYVRPGAQRIGVNNSGSPLTVLAFYNTNNAQFTITGVNSNSTASTLSCSLTGLPNIPGLNFIYTTSSTNLCNGGYVPVTNGSFSVVVPASCVFTLTYSNASPYFLPPVVQNGNILHSLVGTPGCTYQITTSSDLVYWTTLTNIVATNNVTQFTDTIVNSSPQLYYRAMLVQ